MWGIFVAFQAEKSSAKMRGMKEEMDKLRASAADRERLSLTAQSLEDRLKERETQVMIRKDTTVVSVPL